MEKGSRSRSKAACQFCRARKLKCDNLQPECSACKVREIPCEYVVRQPAPRPSNATIQALQAENERLRRLLGPDSIEAGVVNPDERESGEFSDAAPPEERTSTAGIQTANPAKKRRVTTDKNNGSCSEDVNVAPIMVSQFHSESNQMSYRNFSLEIHKSNFYNGRQDEARKDEPNSPLDSQTKDILRSQLVAAAARQRQTEALPSSSRAYDYDGYDPELVMHLLNIHFNRQHHNLLLIYRPLFMRDFAARGPYFSKLLLNAILFASSKFSPRVDIRKEASRPSTAGWQFRQRFKNLLGEAMDESSITTIQALITVASSLFAVETTAKSTAWLYSGIAFRMIIDLGLNIDGAELLNSRKITAEDLEARRRVFWGAFVFDKIHSMYFGRPVALQETNVRVPIEFLDDYEELEQWTPLEPLNESNNDYELPLHPGGASFSVTTFSALCKLSLSLARIMNEIYSESSYSPGRDPTSDAALETIRVMTSIHLSLNRWWTQLPEEIRFEPWKTGVPLLVGKTPTPTVLSLHCLYHMSIVLLQRPFITKGHLFNEHHAHHALNQCITAAIHLAHTVRAYCHAFTIRRTPYFIAYSAYVAITILIRVAAHTRTGSVTHQCLQTCMGILAESEKTNAGVKRARFVVRKLLFAVARKIPNPFSSGTLAPPWGEILSDKFVIDASTTFQIISSFSLSSPDTTGGRSEWDSHVDPALNTPGASDVDHSLELDNDGAAHLLASLRSTTPAIIGTLRSLPPLEASTPFPDAIFGLHGDDAFQSWPDFDNHLENIYDWPPSGLIPEVTITE